MKRIALLIIIMCFSCQEKHKSNHCSEIEKSYDSLLKSKKEIDKIPFNRFSNILNMETGTAKDSILIAKYQTIMGNDSLVDLYIWDRIHTINQNMTQLNVYNSFKGVYRLKQIHNKKYAQLTKIIIKKDSCYLFKGENLLIKKNLNS